MKSKWLTWEPGQPPSTQAPPKCQGPKVPKASNKPLNTSEWKTSETSGTSGTCHYPPSCVGVTTFAELKRFVDVHAAGTSPTKLLALARVLGIPVPPTEGRPFVN